MSRPFYSNRQQINYRCPPPNHWNTRPPGALGPIRPRTFRPRMNYNPNYSPSGPNDSFLHQEYWCETCDKGFQSETHLQNHRKEHQKCNIDGCQFIAHPKIITKHIQMQHSTGLYKKLANLNKPEEIEKWREERRKKYPTKANIEKKMAAVKEKIERGEKMGLNRKHNKNRVDSRQVHPGNKRKQNRNENHPRFKHVKPNEKNEEVNQNDLTKGEIVKPKIEQEKRKPYKVLPEVEINRRLKPFTGIQDLIEDINGDDIPVVDDMIEDDIDLEMITNHKEPVICGALSTLIGEYGSSDEDDNKESNGADASIDKIHKANRLIQITVNPGQLLDENKSVLTANHSKPINNKVNDLNKKDSLNDPVIEDKTTNMGEDDDSGPEEVKFDKTKTDNHNQEQNKKPVMMKKKEIVTRNVFRRPKPKLPSTLLHRLLSREMQHERNVILQCVRYITRSNYFDKSS